MKKIYTVRSPLEQQEYLWDGHSIGAEVSACIHRSITSALLKHLPKNESVIEAGCGLGAWVIFLHQSGYRIEGIDNNRAVIEELKAWNPELRVQEGNILQLPYPNDSVGAYISLGVVEHFEDGSQKALQEAFRVVKPGGFLFLTVPANNLFRRLVAHPLRSLYLFYHMLKGRSSYFAEYRYSSQEVQNMVEEAGFETFESGTDDFISKSQSLALWSEFPVLRGQKLYTLNTAGSLLAKIINSISRKILSAGVLIIARKPDFETR